jgi:hypothetical protein
MVVLGRARRDAVLDALDLADELRFVLGGPLGRHIADETRASDETTRRYIPMDVACGFTGPLNSYSGGLV